MTTLKKTEFTSLTDEAKEKILAFVVESGFAMSEPEITVIRGKGEVNQAKFTLCFALDPVGIRREVETPEPESLGEEETEGASPAAIPLRAVAPETPNDPADKTDDSSETDETETDKTNDSETETDDSDDDDSTFSQKDAEEAAALAKRQDREEEEANNRPRKKSKPSKKDRKSEVLALFNTSLESGELVPRQEPSVELTVAVALFNTASTKAECEAVLPQIVGGLNMSAKVGYALNSSLASNLYQMMDFEAIERGSDSHFSKWWKKFKTKRVWNDKAGSRICYCKGEEEEVEPYLQQLKDTTWGKDSKMKLSDIIKDYLFAGVLLLKYPDLKRIRPNPAFKWEDTLGGVNRHSIRDKAVEIFRLE